MITDTSEQGLERRICTVLTGAPCDVASGEGVAERPASYGVGWICGDPQDYDRGYCVDLVQLAAFLQVTQPEVAEGLDLGNDSPTRRQFLARLQGQISKRGTIDVIRRGVKHGPHDIDVFYGTPSAENLKAQELYRLNRFSVTRQLRYSQDQTALSLDVCLFINGLPIATFELKNSLTKQTVDDAVEQYKRDRNPRERLFELGRCLAHFAVDEHEVKFCTQLRGKASWFLPFNQGWNDGAGNPPNPNGLKTDYLWRQVLTRDSLTNIIENYAQIVESKDQKTGSKKRTQIWPRYHQLEVVRRLLADASSNGAGTTYLIQHSAGEREVELDCVAGAPADRAGAGGRDGLRLGDRGDRPQAAGPADPGHDQAVRAGRVGGGPCVDIRQPARPAADGQADRDHDGPEIPVHPGRHWRRAPGAPLRDHH